MSTRSEADKVRDAFNSAINFCLDSKEDVFDSIDFLALWREGDWERIRKDFPDFDLGPTMAVQEVIRGAAS